MYKDITGNRYSRLTAIRRVGTDKHGRSIWLFKCDCGNEKEIEMTSVIKKGAFTKSCGCLNDEVRKSGINGTRHGLGKTRLNRIWCAMKTRCNNPNDNYYHRYGGRGIKVCDEWNGRDGFLPFYEWAMANGYRDDLTIDRIDSDGDYTPENCRWATMSEQARNKKGFPTIEYNGEIHTVREWAEKMGMKKSTLLQRLNRNHWSIERALTTPVMVRNKAHK